MSEPRVTSIEQARAVRAQIPDGPWGWFGNVGRQNLYLATQWGGRKVVMDFDAWPATNRRIGDNTRFVAEMLGMQAGELPAEVSEIIASIGAGHTPRFQVFTPPDLSRGKGWGCGVMKDAADYARTNHNGEVLGLDNPVAQAIELLPDLVDFLLGQLDTLRTALLRYGTHHPGDDEGLAGTECRSIHDGPDTCNCGLDEALFGPRVPDEVPANA